MIDSAAHGNNERTDTSTPCEENNLTKASRPSKD